MIPSHLQSHLKSFVLCIDCREGNFGACFSSVPASGETKIYAARLGGRVWEAGLDGNVVATHKVKDMVSVPPSPVLGCRYVRTYMCEALSSNYVRMYSVYRPLSSAFVNLLSYC